MECRLKFVRVCVCVCVCVCGPLRREHQEKAGLFCCFCLKWGKGVPGLPTRVMQLSGKCSGAGRV